MSSIFINRYLLEWRVSNSTQILTRDPKWPTQTQHAGRALHAGKKTWGLSFPELPDFDLCPLHIVEFLT